ncbi:hypothetical protein 18India_16 [Salmonella phage 18-India]|nr:hypothetical protein 18India_16 [Salmonella phage 18-India]
MSLYDYDAGLLKCSPGQKLPRSMGSIGKPLTDYELWHYHTRIANMVPSESIMDNSITKNTGSDASDVLVDSWFSGFNLVAQSNKARTQIMIKEDQISRVCCKSGGPEV